MAKKTHELTYEQAYAINEIAQEIHHSCVTAGWYSDIDTGKPIRRNEGEMIALMHSELSEALEGLRKNLPDDHLPERSMVEVELADTIIRILDYAAYKNMDIGGAIKEKFSYNQSREDHKIQNRRKVGGKKM